MKRKAKTWRWWIWCGVKSGRTVFLSRGKPEWRYGGRLGWWWFQYPAVWAKETHPMFKELLGLSRLPPRGVAWLVEVSAPGRSRIVKKLKGGA
jgi:hypothetical protein